MIQKDFILQTTGETMIQIGDLVRVQPEYVEFQHGATRGCWLVVETKVTWRARHKALCAKGSKRRWFWLNSLEKL